MYIAHDHTQLSFNVSYYNRTCKRDIEDIITQMRINDYLRIMLLLIVINWSLSVSLFPLAASNPNNCFWNGLLLRENWKILPSKEVVLLIGRHVVGGRCGKAVVKQHMKTNSITHKESFSKLDHGHIAVLIYFCVVVWKHIGYIYVVVLILNE